MDFAKSVLEKYGWKEGQGLGRNNNGISKPLKANLKFDTSGLGVNKADEFNNHWWERVFNDAAENIYVNGRKKDEEVTFTVKDKDSLEITTKNYSIKKLKKKSKNGGLDYFVKKTVLTGLKEDVTNDENSEDKATDIEVIKYKMLTDDELFAACGGLTAHKAARHGLNLAGKLARIEAHEQKVLNSLEGKSVAKYDDDKVVSRKKKRKLPSEILSQNQSNENLVTSKKSKKKKCSKGSAPIVNSIDSKKSDKIEGKNPVNDGMVGSSEHDPVKKTKKKKKSKNRDSPAVGDLAQSEQVAEVNDIHTKKKERKTASRN